VEEVEPCYQYENENVQNKQYAQNAKNDENQKSQEKSLNIQHSRMDS